MQLAGILFCPWFAKAVNEGLSNVSIFGFSRVAQIRFNVPAIDQAAFDPLKAVHINSFLNAPNEQARFKDFPANWHPVAGDHFNSDNGLGLLGADKAEAIRIGQHLCQ